MSGSRRIIGDHDGLRGPGQSVYIHLAVHQPLGDGDEDVPRPAYLVHLLYRFGAVGQGRDSPRAADFEDAVRPGYVGRDQRRRGHTSTLPRGRYDGDLLHAGNARRDNGHQDGGGVAGRAAGDVDPHPFDGVHYLSHALLHELLDGITELRLMEGSNSVGRRIEGIDKAAIHILVSRGDLFIAYGQIFQGYAVELFRQLLERSVTALTHIGQYLLNGILVRRLG